MNTLMIVLEQDWFTEEFYKDTELDPEDSLMFKITLVPFGSLDSPKFI